MRGPSIRARGTAAFSVLVLSFGCAGGQITSGGASPPVPVLDTPTANMASAPSAIPAPPPAAMPTGSLYAASRGSLFRDIKARQVGDLLTITVSEESQGSKTAGTQTSRTRDIGAQMKFAGVGAGASGVANPVGQASFGPLSFGSTNTFNGTGSTTKTDSMKAYMTASVTDVLGNGNLVIRGSRWTKVNDELQQIVLEGVVRPNDISRENTVLSQNIAEAKIFLVGKGPVTRQQKPGWLGQLFDLLSPF